MSQFTALTANGDLDSEFNGTGKKSLMFPNRYYNFPHAAEGPDGNLYFVALVDRSGTTAIGIACLHKDGTPNVAFGTDGFVFQSFDSQVIIMVPKIHFIEDGAETKILICWMHGYSKNYLARFHMDGRLDRTFGVEGLHTIELPKGLSGNPEHAPTPLRDFDNRVIGTSKIVNGKIYLSGRVASSSNVPTYAILTRLNADCSKDTSFNKTGFVNVFKNMDGVDEIRISEIFVHNGKITVCGWLDASVPGGTSLRYCMLARLNENGTFDEHFADKGFLLDQNPGMSFESITRYSEDSILVAGRQNGVGVLACYNKEGQPDVRFNDGKILYHHFPENRQGGFYSVTADQGKIIVSGTVYLTQNTGLLIVACYLMNGSPDLSFGKGNGWASADFNGYFAYHSNMLIQRDGKVVVVGDSISYEYFSMPIARFLNTTG